MEDQKSKAPTPLSEKSDAAILNEIKTKLAAMGQEVVDMKITAAKSGGQEFILGQLVADTHYAVKEHRLVAEALVDEALRRLKAPKPELKVAE